MPLTAFPKATVSAGPNYFSRSVTTRQISNFKSLSLIIDYRLSIFIEEKTKKNVFFCSTSRFTFSLIEPGGSESCQNRIYCYMLSQTDTHPRRFFFIPNHFSMFFQQLKASR